MGTSFYVLMSILGVVAAVNMFTANAQKESKARTFGMWSNGMALVLIVIAMIIAFAVK